RGPKDLWDGADRATDDALRPLELLPDVERRQTTEMRVAPGVISEGAGRARGTCRGGPDSPPAPDGAGRGPGALSEAQPHVRAPAVLIRGRHPLRGRRPSPRGPRLPVPAGRRCRASRYPPAGHPHTGREPARGRP